jgi:hypothetical protein
VPTDEGLYRHPWLGNIHLRSRLDLVAARRQLIALRSLHSHDRRITSLINNLIAKIGHLAEPQSFAHEKTLRNRIAETFVAVNEIASRKQEAGGTRSCS